MVEKQAAVEESFGDGQEDSYDAVVVGSGYGGSVAACRLSMAGVRVCLIEKGRKWESQDFPTDVSKILSAFRMENQNLGLSFGPKDALFQVFYLPVFTFQVVVLSIQSLQSKLLDNIRHHTYLLARIESNLSRDIPFTLYDTYDFLTVYIYRIVVLKACGIFPKSICNCLFGFGSFQAA